MASLASFEIQKVLTGIKQDLTPLPLTLYDTRNFVENTEKGTLLHADFGAYAMRGYILGRHRDEQMAMAQLEYRLPIYRR
ncbi:hypothetical protein VIN01S_04920 [Vibrio inusitatus NBRC 102082]|uniref:Uncharacterized protein n=1 Tax=Vibrio inusitatus NBRC 102082 TaxID=1219070 RepID=A0A4Y3HRL4_9VIBR|nr:hypothetical protein [Vibrio inusitatus]GEA49688.1 hypothetical protein VIN01S_04920 [Vibrio inusitatus NBRC 102082]